MLLRVQCHSHLTPVRQDGLSNTLLALTCPCHIRNPAAADDPCSDPTFCVHGICDAVTGCSCDAGWGGPNCDTQLTFCDVDPCGNHGKCDNTTGACNCDAGWMDAYCTTCKTHARRASVNLTAAALFSPTVLGSHQPGPTAAQR